MMKPGEQDYSKYGISDQIRNAAQSNRKGQLTIPQTKKQYELAKGRKDEAKE